MNMEMDTNVDNYSTEDLLTILDLDDEPTEQDIIRTTNQFNDKYTDDGNDDLANFFICALLLRTTIPFPDTTFYPNLFIGGGLKVLLF